MRSIIAALAARLLVGKEVYRHLLFVCSAARAVQAENRTTSDPNEAIIEDSYPSLAQLFHCYWEPLPLIRRATIFLWQSDK